MRLFGGFRGFSPRHISPSPPIHIDSCLQLENEGLALVGWCALAIDKPLEVRVKSDTILKSKWFPVIRIDRPDVRAYLQSSLAIHAPNNCLGFVGYIRSLGASFDGRADLEFRCGIFQWNTSVEISSAQISEDLFAGIQSLSTPYTVKSLEPIIQIIRHARPVEPPQRSIAYQSNSCESTSLVNVVVPVYRSYEYVRHLLLSVSGSHTNVCSLTLVCDDPGIVEGFVGNISSWNDEIFHSPVRVIVHDKNSGFSHACNSGWLDSKSPYQLLLNSDVVAQNFVEDLTSLVEIVENGAAVAAPALLFPNGLIQHVGMKLIESLEFPGFDLPIHLQKNSPTVDLPRDPFEVSLLSGAAMLMRTNLLRDVGGVPVVFGRGDFEDVLLSSLLHRSGPLIVNPQICWTHMEGSSYDRMNVGGVPLVLAKSVIARERIRQI